MVKIDALDVEGNISLENNEDATDGRKTDERPTIALAPAPTTLERPKGVMTKSQRGV